jgi:CD109 antigen
LQVLIHSYLGHPVGAKVILDNSENAFSLMEGGFVKIIESYKMDSGVGVVSFLLTPTKIGTITLRLKAVAATNEAGDALTQPLIVKPPGVKQSKNDAVFLNLLKERKVTKMISAYFPEQRVPEADTLKVTVIGDILGGVITNLDKLIQMPCGCGEQNMINFVPDIVILNYLKGVNSLTHDVKERALSYLETGYQRELTFKRFDGSFSAFGNSDQSGSTWLTAFVVRSFISAKR